MTVTKVNKVYELTIMYRNTRGLVSPFSKSKQNDHIKIPWGTPTMCEYILPTGEEEGCGSFVFNSRRRDSAKFSLSEFSSFEEGKNMFAKQVAGMIVDGKQSLLALYLACMVHSSEFVHHREGFHTSEGFQLQGYDEVLSSVVKFGGSLADYQNFINLAKREAKVVENASVTAQDITRFFVPKRSLESETSGSVSAKKTKADIIDDLEKQELKDPEGLEKKHQEGIVGLANIPLDNLEVASTLENTVNNIRVNRIILSLKSRYDPSLSIPVVCPKDENASNIDLNNVETTKFLVVQKVHLVKAFQVMHRNNEFTKLSSHCDGTVICFVVKLDTDVAKHHANLKGNDIMNRFARPVRPQDLIGTFYSLSQVSNDGVDAMKSIDRMLRLFRIGPNESTSVRKICSWSNEPLEAFMKVKNEFENFQTLDVDESKSKYHGKLIRGEKMTFTNALLNSIAKVDEEKFLAGHSKILSNVCSVKSFVEEQLSLKKLQDVAGVLSIIADHRLYDDLATQYEGKFELERLEPFVGAEIKKGVLNDQAARLKKYYKSIIEKKVYEDEVEFIVYRNLTEHIREYNFFSNYDALVLFVGDKDSTYVFSIINESLIEMKPFSARLIVFKDEILYSEVLNYMRQLKSPPEYMKILPLLFHSKSSRRDFMSVNVNYSVLFGKFIVQNPPIEVYHSSLNDIGKILDNICPPNVSAACIADPSFSLSRIHTQEGKVKKVTYFGIKSEVDKLASHCSQSCILLNDSCLSVGDDGLPDSCLTIEHSVTDSEYESTTSPFKSSSTSSLYTYNSSGAQKAGSNIIRKLDEMADSIDD